MAAIELACTLFIVVAIVACSECKWELGRYKLNQIVNVQFISTIMLIRL